MSAREEIEFLFGENLSQLGKNFLSDKLDAYAHELAEKIRKGYEGNGPDEDNWIMSPYDAADLIDPRVK